MKNLLLIVVFTCFSCLSTKGLIVVKYTGYNNLTQKSYVYKTYIKKGFIVEEIHGGNEWKQKVYKYPDSSIFYISNEEGNTSFNYDNIRNDKIQSNKSLMAFANKDTIIVQGVDKNGNYWKNKFDGKVNVGYLNITKDRKEEFESILSSLVKK